MEKPYYKSQLRLQKRNIHRHVVGYWNNEEIIYDFEPYHYKYKQYDLNIAVHIHKDKIKVIIFSWPDEDTFGFLIQNDRLFGKIIVLSVKRLVKRYNYLRLPIILSAAFLYEWELVEDLLQCEFILQYTKELGYHFIR
jgi:hypothetical protein